MGTLPGRVMLSEGKSCEARGLSSWALSPEAGSSILQGLQNLKSLMISVEEETGWNPWPECVGPRPEGKAAGPGRGEERPEA